MPTLEERRDRITDLLIRSANGIYAAIPLGDAQTAIVLREMMHRLDEECVLLEAAAQEDPRPPHSIHPRPYTDPSPKSGSTMPSGPNGVHVDLPRPAAIPNDIANTRIIPGGTPSGNAPPVASTKKTGGSIPQRPRAAKPRIRANGGKNKKRRR